MRKLTKKWIAALCLATVLMGSSISVMAQSVRETEPNDTMDTAEEILANRQTAQNYIDANDDNTYVEKGSVSKTDEDWFKVYLESGKDNYFSIYSDLLYFRLYDSAGVAVTENIYVTDATTNYQVFDLGNLPSGYYYIRLTGTSASNSYQFLIGNPVYRGNQVSVQGEKISLSSSNSVAENKISFSENDYPEDALIYQISINGVNSTYTSKVNLAYSESGKTFSKTSAVAWGTINVPLSYEFALDGNYTFTYYYKSSAKTFTPTYKFYYVYPILPQGE